MRKTAPEIIGEHLCWELSEVKDGKYQSYTAPAVYVCGNDYFCCPNFHQKLHKEFNAWEPVYTCPSTKRIVYRASGSE